MIFLFNLKVLEILIYYIKEYIILQFQFILIIKKSQFAMLILYQNILHIKQQKEVNRFLKLIYRNLKYNNFNIRQDYFQ